MRREDNEWFENQTRIGFVHAHHFNFKLNHVGHDYLFLSPSLLKAYCSVHKPTDNLQYFEAAEVVFGWIHFEFMPLLFEPRTHTARSQ